MALDGGGEQRRPNLSAAAQRYLDRLGLDVEDLFHHVLSVLHDPSYRKANAGALRMEWPRIPLPGWPDGDTQGAAEELKASAARGREIAALLDSETLVSGVTRGALRPEIAAIAVPTTTDRGNMAGDDFSLTASWGHFGQGEAVMPGQGRVVERPHTAEERAALGSSADTLGNTTFDVQLNDRAYWRNVPAAVWSYKLGGYRMLKKWLSPRLRRLPYRVTAAFAGGGDGTMTGSNAAPYGPGGRLELFGTDGYLFTPQPGVNPMPDGVVYGAKAGDGEVSELPMPERHHPFDDPTDRRSLPFRRLLREFRRGITEGTSLAPNFADGYRCQLVLDAIRESSQPGRWVEVPPE